MRFHIITHGCQMNVCDSDWLHRALVDLGGEPADEESAEVFVVNTCSVREKPEQKVYSLLGRLQGYWQRNPNVFVAVGGCVAQQVGTRFWKRFPHVRLVFGTDGIAMVPQAVDRLRSDPQLRLSLLDFEEHYPEREQLWPEAEVPAQAFVNIMQGCDNYCAYCIVPYTRGRQKSRSSAAVLQECRELARRGAREITLLGQNVNSYGQDANGDGTSFAALLEQVCAIPGIEQVRFTTSHPKDIAPEVIAAFGRLPELSPHLHLPLQSGSDRILKAMRRRYTRQRYLDIVTGLRQARPEITLTTDLIVGFPGETEADFEQTLEMMREVGFASSFSFKYSDRPGVAAEQMEDKVPEEIKSHRLQRLQSLQEELTGEALQAEVGRHVTVLLREPGRQDGGGVIWRGRDPGGRVVNCRTELDSALIGSYVGVRVTEAKKHSLFGEVETGPW
ncbi:tRNA (N6-isopentenyl adenosine(37)-C2)-methylthiotransferase MiaB [Desulfohalobium retbaense]|uniref:tRNA-2-methylthio-N(6)-dimethylallyladenosine synthase n=1 Tax=Desulfohalobium retbaense (strain ATCC 49708 / DSM 5692 / JCM 16813 / HR100) TaxID=485915 RepID=C8X378_DESRD|nr:tRNA (N6-isopentenyl adenosine(37)-C2)-methylthiotransferase MiaB [Desulfohalobium retbaense]ACV68875.1 RNA modification enzyme, MiaB family [Desulfohalobium retbaense DSM 5692]